VAADVSGQYSLTILRHPVLLTFFVSSADAVGDLTRVHFSLALVVIYGIFSRSASRLQ